jgi:predicted Zn-dependent protease
MRAALDIVRSKASGDARAERAARLMHVQTLLEAGDVPLAGQVLDSMTSDQTRPVMLLRAQLALAAGPSQAERLARAAAELRTRVAVAPRDAIAWQVLSQVHEQLDQPLQSVRAAAEAQLALGDLSGAIDRLRAGQRLARTSDKVDFVEASVIDARLREVEAQRRALAAELRGERGDAPYN